MNNNVYLSQNAIETLMGLASPSLTSNETVTLKVNLNMQICGNKYNSAFNMSFYLMSDLSYNYDNFLIKKNAKLVNLYDILNITEVNSYYDTQHMYFVYYITAYKVIANANFKVIWHTKNYLASTEPIPLKLIAPNSLNYWNYTLIRDLPNTINHITLLVKVKRKSTVTYNQSNNKKCFYFEAIDIENNKLRVYLFEDKASAFYKPNSCYSIVKIGCYYEIKGDFVESRHNQQLLEDIPEIILSSHSTITKIAMNNPNEKESKINNIVTIKELLTLTNYLLVNILVKVLETQTIEFELNDNKPEGRRKIIVIDESGFQIEVILNDYFTLYSIKENDILFLDTFQINPQTYKDRKILSSVFDSKIYINPNDEKAEALNNFLKVNTNSIIFKTDLSQSDYYRQCFISELKVTKGKVKIKGVVTAIEISIKNIYEGCIDESCKAPLYVRNMTNYCTKCNKGPISPPEYYYRLNVRIQDCSGSTSAILDNRCANKLIQISAHQYKTFLFAMKKDLTKIISLKKYIEMYFFTNEASSNRPIEINQIKGINKPLETREMSHKLKSMLSNKFLL